MPAEPPESPAWPEAALARLAASAGRTPAQFSRELHARAQLFAQCPPDHVGFEAMRELGYRPHPHLELCAWCRTFRATLHGSAEQWHQPQPWGTRFRRRLEGALLRLVGR
jgi:hypothetical protein